MIDRLTAITEKRTAPGSWRLHADAAGVVMDIGSDRDDHQPLCRGHDYDDYGEIEVADAAAIVAMDHTYEALLAVAEAARVEVAHMDGEHAYLACHWGEHTKALRAALDALEEPR